MNNSSLAIGVDLGGTNTSFGIVDSHGEVLKTGLINTVEFGNDFDSYIDKLSDRLEKLMQQAGSKVTGIGVGAPNGNFFTRNIEYAPNLPWKGIIPLADLLEKRLDVPVFLTNDANAAAKGEALFGVARGMENFIMVTLGTGVGGGIFVNGDLLYGNDGFAGELGHIIIRRNGRLCGCGRRGCLETYASAPGIVRTMKELQGKDNPAIPNGEEALSAKAITDLARSGDPLALKALRSTARVLGEALANFVAFSAPEAVILFGGVVNTGDLLLKPTRYFMEKNMHNLWTNKIKLLPSSLNKNGNAAILGASSLVFGEKRVSNVVI